MERTESQKEKEHIITAGYRYRKHRVNADGSVSWRCFKRDCQGRIKIVQEDTRTLITEHNHAPDPELNEAKKITFEVWVSFVTGAGACDGAHSSWAHLSLGAFDGAHMTERFCPGRICRDRCGFW